MANGSNGIHVSELDGSLVGGTTAGARNIISGNTLAGIFLSANNISDSLIVQGNYIGTDITGTLAVPNGVNGILIRGNAQPVLIGGTVTGAGNVISGNNGYGVHTFRAPSGVIVEGNFIGVDATGTAPLGNTSAGVRIFWATMRVGGTIPGAGNIIAYNGGNGVAVDSRSEISPIWGNSIFNNAGLGIGFLGESVTPNDPGDGDTGPNNLQNFPVITSAETSGGSITVAGTFNSNPNTNNFRLEFFANTICNGDVDGNPQVDDYGEGETFLGFTTVNTDGNGDASFSVTLSAKVPGGAFITATATHPNNSTSEFSQCLEAVAIAKPYVLLANGTLIIDQPRNAFGDVHANEWIVFEDAPGNKLTGNVTAVEEITINDGNTIIGDVTAGGDIDNDGTVTGTMNPNANVPAELLPVLDPIIPGTDDINVPNSAVQSLAPGDYKNIMIGRKATLKFSPGTYNINQLYASDEAKLNFDVASGKITLNIADGLFLDDYVRFGGVTVANIEDTDSLTINIAGDDLIEIGMNSLVYGTIVAPDADIDFGDNTLFKGAVCAEDIKMKEKVRFLHHSFGTSSTGPVVGKGSNVFGFADAELDRELADLFSEVPDDYRLEQNYPNPFNPSTTIQFALPEVSQVTLTIYNMTGQLVRTLVSAELAPGQHSFTWDASDASGRRVSSGMYLYQLRADGPSSGSGQAFTAQRKLLLMK